MTLKRILGAVPPPLSNNKSDKNSFIYKGVTGRESLSVDPMVGPKGVWSILIGGGGGGGISHSHRVDPNIDIAILKIYIVCTFFVQWFPEGQDNYFQDEDDEDNDDYFCCHLKS